jgi:hypothetical protein
MDPAMKPEAERYTVAVDFDGVIHSYTSPWTKPEEIPDPPVEGAIDWLNEISKDFRVVIHTTRARTFDGAAAVVVYLHRHGYTVMPEDISYAKPPALIYLDDRAVRFEGPGTFPSAQEIHDARPWNKR